MSRVRVAYVITEPHGRIDDQSLSDQRHEVAQLRATCGAEVFTSHYTAPLPAADVLVLSGSRAPWSAHATVDLDRLGEVLVASWQPVLGICAGLQLLARFSGGRVSAMSAVPEEHGFCAVDVEREGGLFAGLPQHVTVYQDHHDEVAALPSGCELLATSRVCRVQAVAWETRPWWGTQFHPEWHDRAHADGRHILANFFALARDALAAAPQTGGR